jgi:hypothetical protein
MRTTMAMATLALVLGVWGCEKSGGEAEAQSPDDEHGHAHQGGSAHGHGDEEGHAHEGEGHHEHEGEKGHHHEEEEGHHEDGEHAHDGEKGHHHDGESHTHEGEEGHHHEGEEGHHHEGEDGHHHDEPDYADKGTVEVPKEGKTFEPAVSIERLPEGAWYCDMGKAPWAAMEQPKDGCPIEGAPLKQVSK